MALRLYISLASVCVAAFAAKADISDDLVALTGTERARLVWTRSGSNAFGWETGFHTDQVLVGFDTKTGVEDTIVVQVSNYQRPLLSRGGCWVVYSSTVDTGVHLVPFDGSLAPRKIARGVAGCLWYDEENEEEYAIYADQFEGRSAAVVKRVNLLDPQDTALVYNQDASKTVNGQWLGVSSDLSTIGCVWGWPACRTYDIVGGGLHVNSNGCWTSMPYDLSKRLVHLNSDHDAVVIREPDNRRREVETGILNHARIASYHSNILCASVGMDENGGRAGGNIAVMLLDTGMTTVEDRVEFPRIAGGGDGFPDLWAGDSALECGHVGAVPPEANASRPGSLRGTVAGAGERAYLLDGRVMRGGMRGTQTGATLIRVESDGARRESGR